MPDIGSISKITSTASTFSRLVTDSLPKKLKIAIASSGRFHVLDLARELDALGHEVRFYSYVPKRRAKVFGLPKRCHVGLLPYVFPLVWWERVFPNSCPSVVERLMCLTLDRLVKWKMRPCDVFICMSGIYVVAARYAKARYGAKIVLQRGSVHILRQAEILAQNPQARQISDFMIERELKGYAVADRISVASNHVVASFHDSAEAAKVHKNPYGVDVAQFPQGAGERDSGTVLYVGQWSYRKGVDVLTDAVMAVEGVRLLHVGPILDLPFPTHERFTHYESVSQDRLSPFYKRAPVFVLASREDGFGVVLSQALASGCLVVCTDKTGGPDLTEMAGLNRLIRIVGAGNAKALATAFQAALRQAAEGTCAPISAAERALLSWRCYAERELRAIEGEDAAMPKNEQTRAFQECSVSL
jgi:starch synthase